MLMAGIDGIKRKIDPRVEGFGPFEVPLPRMPEEERKRIRSLPLALGAVLDALEKDHQFLLDGRGLRRAADPGLDRAEAEGIAATCGAGRTRGRSRSTWTPEEPGGLAPPGSAGAPGPR